MSRTDLSFPSSGTSISLLLERLVASWSSGVAIAEGAPGGRIAYVNKAFETLTGHAPSEALGRSLTELISPRESASFSNLLENASRSQGLQQGTALLVRRDGSRVSADIEVFPISPSADGILHWVTTLNDATSRLSLENALQQSEARHRALAENTRDLVSRRKETEATLTAMHGLLSTVYEAVPVGLCLLDNRNYVQLCNRAFAQLLGGTPGEFAGRPISVAIPLTEVALATGQPGLLHTFEATRQDGGHFPAELAVTLIRVSEATWRLLTLNDLTERRRLEARLREARQLESLSTLAGGIAHDFNNMLTIILGYAGLLTEQAGDPVALERAANAITDASRRGADVVRQLQLFANQHELELVPTDLQALIDETIQRTCADWPDNVQVSSIYELSSATISIDPAQVALGLRHLLQNACDALPNGGSVKVRTSESVMTLAHGDPVPALRVTVEDSGHGMDDSTRTRMFDPFFAKNKGPAVRGLGLAVVYGIMRAHRGQIEVDTAPGQGTRVHLSFPRDAHPHAEASADGGAAAGGRAAKSPRQCVLVVEDETDIGRLWENVFEAEGISMRWARDGEEALRLFAAHRDEIGLLFSDIGLPGIDGWQVAKRIRSELPALPILLVSGAFKPGDRAEAELGPPAICLPKPFPPSEVLSHVRRFLHLTA